MAFGIGGFSDGISLRLSAQTSDFNAGLRGARRRLEDVRDDALGVMSSLGLMGKSADGARNDALELAGSLSILDGRADEAGDELVDLGGRGYLASSGITSLSLSSEGATIAVSNLSGALMLSLLPALITIGGALVPVVAALGGIATIGAAFAGIGLVGGLAAAATHGEQLKEQLLGVWETFQDVFAPAIDMAVAVLSSLISEFESILPALLPSKSALTELGGIFVMLGSAVIQALPALTELAVTLVRRFGPAMIELVQGAMTELPGLLSRLADVAGEVGPMFLDAWDALRALMPALMEFGMTALPVVANVLGTLTTALQRGLEWFNQLGDGIESTLTQASLAAPVLLGMVAVLGGPVTAAIGAAIALVIGLKKAWETNFLGIRDIVTRYTSGVQTILNENLGPALEAISGILGKLHSGFKTVWGAIGPIVRPVVSFLVDYALGTILNVLDLVISGFTAFLQLLNGDVPGAMETLSGAFERVFGRMLDFVDKWTGGFASTLVNGIVDAINVAGSTLEEWINSLPGVSGVSIGQVQGINTGGMDAGARYQGMTGRKAEQVVRHEQVVRFEGSGDAVTEIAAQEANRQLQNEQDRQSAGIGRNSMPMQPTR